MTQDQRAGVSIVAELHAVNIRAPHDQGAVKPDEGFPGKLFAPFFHGFVNLVDVFPADVDVRIVPGGLDGHDVALPHDPLPFPVLQQEGLVLVSRGIRHPGQHLPELRQRGGFEQIMQGIPFKGLDGILIVRGDEYNARIAVQQRQDIEPALPPPADQYPEKPDQGSSH